MLMDTIEGNNGKKNFLVKTWNWCQSFGKGGVSGMSKNKLAPEGCFPVYVGLEKQRFNIKTKYANHPLFTMLLEDAETEYGHNSNGPLSLPCDVDLFFKVLAEMEANDALQLGWGFAYSSCSPFNTRHHVHGAQYMGKGYGSYAALTPSKLD
ncbi:small auxin-up RNA [Tanacetum coccineum]